jgi:hypothetical protein
MGQVHPARRWRPTATFVWSRRRQNSPPRLAARGGGYVVQGRRRERPRITHLGTHALAGRRDATRDATRDDRRDVTRLIGWVGKGVPGGLCRGSWSASTRNAGRGLALQSSRRRAVRRHCRALAEARSQSRGPRAPCRNSVTQVYAILCARSSGRCGSICGGRFLRTTRRERVEQSDGESAQAAGVRRTPLRAAAGH